MNELAQKYIESREVAEMVGKEHSKLLRDIRTYAEQLAEAKIGLGDFFAESTYLDANNQSRPCYLVTKKGCEFIAHKMTGQKGTEFTAKYINRFYKMETQLKVPQTTSGQIQLLAQGYTELEQKVDSIGKDLQDFKQDLPLLAIECERITRAVKTRGVDVLGGKQSEAYKDNSLRNKVYSDIYGEIKRQFGVNSYKAIKRSQCEKAIDIVSGYQLPMVIAEEVADANAQMNF